MNIDAMSAQMGRQITRVANDVEAAMKGDIQNDPEAMLKLQYELQQYSVMVNYQSAVYKTFKDMMSGIISKIG